MTDQDTSRLSELTRHARALARKGEDGIAEARRLLEAEIRKDSNEFLPLDAEVDVLVLAGERKLARDLLEEYLRWHPNNADASARLAWLMWESGEKEEAIAEIRATLARQEDHLQSRLWYIEWLEERRDAEMLREAAETGLRHHPENARLLMARAASELRRGNPSASIEIYRGIIERDPDWMPAVRALSLLLSRRKQHDQAIELVGPRAQRPDAGLKTLCCAAEVYFQSTRIPEALEFAGRAANHPKGNVAKAQQKLVESLFRVLRKEDAKRFAFELIEQRGTCDEFASALIDHFAGVPEPPSFERVLKTIMKHPTAFPKALSNALLNHPALISRGAVDEWLANRYQAIIAEREVWAAVGRWLFERGNLERAADVLSQNPLRKGVRPATLLTLGICLERGGRESDANQYYREALRLKPDSSEPSIRARLAFNLAMDGYDAAGHLILDDCSEGGRKVANGDDLIRIYAVESLVTSRRLRGREELRELFVQSNHQMKEIAREQSCPDSERLIALFQQRCEYLLSVAATNDSA